MQASTLGRRLAVAAVIPLMAVLSWTVPAHGDVAGGGAAKAVEQFVASVARTGDGRAVDDAETAKEVQRYWTPERMREADRNAAARAATTRAVPTGTASESAPTGPAVSVAPHAPPAAVADLAAKIARDLGPTTTVSLGVGKVYFHNPWFDRPDGCSAATVNSPSLRLVMTAGHCVNTGGTRGGLWVDNWVYRPGLDESGPFDGPLGGWSAGYLTTTVEWVRTGDNGVSGFEADVGIAVMLDEEAFEPVYGTGRIGYVAGANGMRINWGTIVSVTLVGYPENPPFNGIRQLTCGPGTTRQGQGTQIRFVPCEFGGGASGGPWLQNYGWEYPGYGYINGVTSNLPIGTINTLDSTYFNDFIAGLYFYAENIAQSF